MKKWKKPELQVLVRHNPEEAVLGGCKMHNNGVTPGHTASCHNADGTSACKLVMSS